MSYRLSPISLRLLTAIRVAAVLFILLQLATPLFTEATAWGLWPITYLPRAVACVLGCLALIVALAGEQLWSRPGVARLARTHVVLSSPWVRAGLALVAGVLFYALRIRHLRWGDAELIVKALADPYRITYIWQAPLDIFIHARGWQLGNDLFGWPDPIPVYRITSTLAGMLFVWVLLGLAALLGRNRTERALLSGLVLTLGTMELFFGYIENYPIMTLGMLVYAYLALLCLRGRTALIWPATALAVTHAFHPSTIILTPSLLYLAFARFRARGRNASGSQDVLSRRTWRMDRATVLSIVVPYALVFLGLVALMSGGGHGLDALMGQDFPGGGDRSWFVPLFKITTEWQHYTMFSLGHLLDIVNQQWLVAPLIWPAIALVWTFARSRVRDAGPEGVFLALMAGFYLLLTVVWNADYGGQKDWDLFSPAAVPAALWLGWLLPRALPERRALRGAGWALVAAQAVHLVAWVWQNSRPQ